MGLRYIGSSGAFWSDVRAIPGATQSAQSAAPEQTNRLAGFRTNAMQTCRSLLFRSNQCPGYSSTVRFWRLTAHCKRIGGPGVDFSILLFAPEACRGQSQKITAWINQPVSLSFPRIAQDLHFDHSLSTLTVIRAFLMVFNAQKGG
jgi:hypothetical protein